MDHGCDVFDGGVRLRRWQLQRNVYEIYRFVRHNCTRDMDAHTSYLVLVSTNCTVQYASIYLKDQLFTVYQSQGLIALRRSGCYDTLSRDSLFCFWLALLSAPTHIESFLPQRFIVGAMRPSNEPT